MRKLLILAFLLCKCLAFIDYRGSEQNDVTGHHYIPDDIIAIATRSNYDYDDVNGAKRHSLIDDRRNWRKKALLKPTDDNREWDKKRYEYDNPRYGDEMDSKSYNGVDRQRELDLSSSYRQPHRYEDPDKLSMSPAIKSSELAHSSAFL